MNRDVKFVACLLLLVVALCLPVQAATLIVDPGTPGAYDTVSDAVAAATADDRIEIAAYTYTENVTVTKTLEIVGIPDPVTGALPVIDGDGADRAISFDGVAVDCSNVNFSDAYIGLLADSGAEPVSLTNVNAYQNELAGIFVDTTGDVTITGCSAEDNEYLGILVVPGSVEVLEMSSEMDTYAPAGDSLAVSDGIAEILMSGAQESGTGFDTVMAPLPESGVVLITGTDTSANGLIGCAAMALSDTELIVTDVSACENGEFDSGDFDTSSPLDMLKSGLTVVAAHNSTATLTGIIASDNVGCGVMALGDIVTATSVTAENNANLGVAVVDFGLLDNVGVRPGIPVLVGSSSPDTAFDAVFTTMTTSVADATVVSEDEFVLGEDVSIYIEDVIAGGPDAILSSIEVNDNGYAGIGVVGGYVAASDITADGNGAEPTDVAGTLTGAGVVGASLVGEYTDITATDNGGAGMAAASLALEIDDSSFSGNGVEAFSETHGPLFKTGLLTVSLVNSFSGVHSDLNAGSGILMTSVITECDGCTASNNAYGGIVAADPLSLGIGALLVHFGPSFISDAEGLSEEDRFYLESLSSQTTQDVLACYGTTDAFVPSAVADTGMDGMEVSFIVDLLHQYLATAEIVVTDSAAEENGLFGMAVVYPNVTTDGFTADGNGYADGSPLQAIAGTGIVGLYITGEFTDTSVSENTGAGLVSIGVVSEYTDVMADDNGYAGIVTIDPLTLAAAAIGYFVILDDTGDEVMVSDSMDLDMHADIAESSTVQEIVATYYVGTSSEGTQMDAVSIPEGGLEILLDHIELYFDNAGVYVTDVSASGNGYPGIVAIAPNVVMDGVTANGNGALNDNESEILALAAGSGVIGLSIAGDYSDIAADGNTGAGIATAGVVTDMTACEADENSVGVVSLFVVGDYTEIASDDNALSGIVLGGINGNLASSSAEGNAGPGIVVVDPVAAVLMHLVFSPVAEPIVAVEATGGMDTSAVYDPSAVSPETLALLGQLSGNTESVSFDTAEEETAWTLIAWAMEHIADYDGDITELNQTEIMDLVLTHYLTGAGLSVTDVTADDNGWTGVVVLSPSIEIENVAADGNGYHGVSAISPWKAVDAYGFVHPAEPVGNERLCVTGVYGDNNEIAGLLVSGANGGDVSRVSCSGNTIGLLLGDSDNLTVFDSAYESNMDVSVLCGGDLLNDHMPAGMTINEELDTDPTGSCNNLFVETGVDSGIVVLPNSTGNEFDGTFFDEAALIGADITSDGPFIVFSTSGTNTPTLPESQFRYHPGGCGMGIVGLYGYNATVNITYDYGYGFPPGTGAGLYPQWTVPGADSWSDWESNTVTNDPDTLTVGTMMVSLSSQVIEADGAAIDVIYLTPFWYETPGGDDGSKVIDPDSGTVKPGDQQAGTPDAGGNDDGVSPTPAAGQDGDGDGSDVPAAMTPAPVSGADSPAGSSPEDLPAGAGASDNGGFLPWIVLIVVLVAIAGGVYFMKFQQK